MRLTWFRRIYGASPLHLLALLASLALAAYVAQAFFALGLSSIVRWFLIALVGHDLVLLPLYTALDWVAFGGERGRARAARARVSAVPYVRVPALLSGLLLLVYAPEILRLGPSYYQQLTGLGDGIYLGRWLGATGVMFALAGLAYAVALRRARGRRGQA
jgi:hypothetical protein